MKLTKLYVHYSEYSGYSGHAEFTGEIGKVEVKLNESHINQIFSVCADAIVSVSKEVASHLTANIIEHKKQIES